MSQTTITPMIGRFLQNASCQNIQKKAHILDCSVGMEAHSSFYQDFQVGLKLLQPFLVKMTTTTDEEFEGLYEQALTDMQSEDFCAA